MTGASTKTSPRHRTQKGGHVTCVVFSLRQKWRRGRNQIGRETNRSELARSVGTSLAEAYQHDRSLAQVLREAATKSR